MQQSAAFQVFVPAFCRAEIAGFTICLDFYGIVAWHIGPAFRVLDHVLTTAGFLWRFAGGLQQGLSDHLEYRVNQETDYQPDQQANQHNDYQLVRNGTSSSMPVPAAASALMVCSSSGCLRSGAISRRGARTKERSWSLGCGMVRFSSQTTWSA